MINEPSMSQAFLDKCREIVEENLDNEQFGVEDLAHKAGLSRSQLHRKLKKLTKQSCSQFIREIRLEHAMELLQQDVATASEIAYRVGFSSPAYFSKCFNDYFGFPPGEAKDKDIVSVQDHIAQSTGTGEHLGFKSKKLWLAGSAIALLVILGTTLFYQNSGQETPVIKPSLAVLPLQNLTGDDEQDYLVDGIHDALIGELGKLSNLRVISRTSTLQFRNPDSNLREIADRLSVDNIIEGSVMGGGNSLRIQLQLIRLKKEEEHLWAKAYDRNISEVLATLSNVSKEVADNIDIALSPTDQERLNQNISVNPEIYKAYLRGMYYLSKATPEDIQRGVSYLQDAVEMDPADPTGYAGLAQAYVKLGHGATPSIGAFQKARAAAETAIKLDPRIAEAHSALGSYKLYFEHDWEGAKKSFIRANELNPNLAWNHYHYAWSLDLFGQRKEAISELKLAHELDPLNPYINGWLAWLYADYGYFDLAQQEVDKTLQLDENHPIGLIASGLLYVVQGEYEKALPIVKKAASVNPAWQFYEGQVYALTGETEKAREILHQIEQKEVSSFNALERVAMYATLGEYDKAFKWLYYEPPHAYVPWVPNGIQFDSLHKDPRFKEFLDAFNLPDINNPYAFSSR